MGRFLLKGSRKEALIIDHLYHILYDHIHIIYIYYTPLLSRIMYTSHI